LPRGCFLSSETSLPVRFNSRTHYSLIYSPPSKPTRRSILSNFHYGRKSSRSLRSDLDLSSFYIRSSSVFHAGSREAWVSLTRLHDAFPSFLVRECIMRPCSGDAGFPTIYHLLSTLVSDVPCCSTYRSFVAYISSDAAVTNLRSPVKFDAGRNQRTWYGHQGLK